MDDKTLRSRIIEELDWDPRFDAANIGVAVEDGVATLTGHVDSYAEKVAVEKVVKRVKGVRAVAEEVEVRTALSSKTTDDQIARRAADALAWNVSVPKNAVSIKVQNGYITLEGEVDWQYQRGRAEECVRNLLGVKGVTNMVKLKSRASTPDIQKRIEEALKRNAAVEAKAIRVAVSDGKVTLEGKVDDWSELEAVESAVWAAPGVTAGVDNIRSS